MFTMNTTQASKNSQMSSTAPKLSHHRVLAVKMHSGVLVIGHSRKKQRESIAPPEREGETLS